MSKEIYSILKLLRPRQWVKNFAIFAAVVFSGQLFNPPIVKPVILGFFVFCGISSASYIINDIFDVKNDKLHPFKTFTVIDILVIASGYILRVLGGEFASGFHISVWLLLTTISISLFLAIGKRRSELTLLSSNKDVNIAAIRKSLSHYSERLLDVYASIFATSTFISYALFTFLETPKGIK